ncbi:MAG TPA: LPS export ABC transporter ATP-binding protein [Oceanospirillales bacterium]|nr:LPS export ABC transporter ATP-binding protein [Oceanospirillales bacterium]
MIVVKDLEKAYKKRKIIKGVSLTVERGEVVGLLGSNGAGKTTCFYMIVGLVQADAGEILIDNIDATKLGMHKRAGLGLGYLPQEASVFRKLTVRQNILAILELRKNLNKQQRNAQAEALMDELNISHVHDQLGISLSGGERRRVEIARALALDLKYILLDEPFAGVDPISIIDIQKIVMHLKNRGLGVLITDHNVVETLGISDRAYILNDGVMLSEGTPEQIISNQKVKDVYLGKNFRM